jgi:hypothetical protein
VQETLRTRRPPTASGVDGHSVKTVGRARGVKTVGRAGGDGTSSLIEFSSFAGAAHAQDADGQWTRQCEDGGARKRFEAGGSSAASKAAPSGVPWTRWRCP